MKTLNFFNYTNDLASRAERSIAKDILSFFSFYPLLFLAAIRIAFSFKFPLKPFEQWLALILLCSPFLQAIFFTRIRFRIPFDFLMIYFAAECLERLIRQRAFKAKVEMN
jgi:hypothetical protein